MYSIIATDLDGTLLNTDHQADPFTVETVRELEARGVRFIIATGRHYRDVVGIRKVLGIDAYLITSNGARIHAPDNERIYARDIAPAAVRRLVQNRQAVDQPDNSIVKNSVHRLTLGSRLYRAARSFFVSPTLRVNTVGEQVLPEPRPGLTNLSANVEPSRVR